MTTNTYIAGKGFLYRFDPRAKLLLMVLFCVWFFLPVTLAGAWCVVLAVVCAGIRNIGFKQVCKTFLTILPMLVFMILFIPFNVRSGVSLWSVGSFVVVTREGLLQTLRLMSRFVGITYVCTLTLQTTPMGKVMLALRWYRLPYKASLVVSLAFRFIPFIADSFSQIRDSHRLRNPNIEDAKTKKSYRARFSDLLPTLTSALVVALRAIPHLAMSLEHRGFGLEGRRTSYHVLETTWRLFTDLFISTIIPVFLWVLFAVR
ncbi:MAG: energy-coupling factor transporter transmembrane component T [Sphaerochaetaceae bacterium]|nr:energy-coupling factor transporter transmembrane component T [Sphaerochaetaceae bacterium]